MRPHHNSSPDPKNPSAIINTSEQDDNVPGAARSDFGGIAGQNGNAHTTFKRARYIIDKDQSGENHSSDKRPRYGDSDSDDCLTPPPPSDNDDDKDYDPASRSAKKPLKPSNVRSKPAARKFGNSDSNSASEEADDSDSDSDKTDNSEPLQNERNRNRPKKILAESSGINISDRLRAKLDAISKRREPPNETLMVCTVKKLTSFIIQEIRAEQFAELYQDARC